MCGTPPKMHAPAADGTALCGQRQVRSQPRVASTTASFEKFVPLQGDTIAAHTSRGGRCKACEKKLQLM